MYIHRVRSRVGRQKESKKKSLKNSQLIIRISTSDRERFVFLCDELDTSAAREIRRFIRDFLKENNNGSDR